jgi:hypothetical protein
LAEFRRSGCCQDISLVKDRIPKAFGLDPIRDVQVECRKSTGRAARQRALAGLISPAAGLRYLTWPAVVGVATKPGTHPAPSGGGGLASI